MMVHFNHSKRSGTAKVLRENGRFVDLEDTETGDLLTVHKAHVHYEPTPAEIAERCAAIREQWPERRFEGTRPQPVELEPVSFLLHRR